MSTKVFEDVEHAEKVRDIRASWFWSLTWILDWQDLIAFGLTIELTEEEGRSN